MVMDKLLSAIAVLALAMLGGFAAVAQPQDEPLPGQPLYKAPVPTEEAKPPVPTEQIKAPVPTKQTLGYSIVPKTTPDFVPELPTIKPPSTPSPRPPSSLERSVFTLVPMGNASEAFIGPPAPERVIISWGGGGNIAEHRMKFTGYRRAGNNIELRGPCYSACTLLTAYVARDKLCIAPGAFLAFHAARAHDSGAFSLDSTNAMYRSQPPEIRAWIDRNGGWQSLPLDGFWTMYDRDLWAMGYQRCASAS